LGAQLAQAGQYERAVAELKRTIALKPELHTARFQLGLLHLTLARPAEASSVWEALEKLEDGAALQLFKRGMEALVRDDFGTCIQLLEAGIAANTANAPLNRDMGLVIAKARAALSTARPDKPAEAPKRQDTEPQVSPLGESAVRTDFSLYDQ
jgi:hypothetical protein